MRTIFVFAIVVRWHLVSTGSSTHVVENTRVSRRVDAASKIPFIDKSAKIPPKVSTNMNNNNVYTLGYPGSLQTATGSTQTSFLYPQAQQGSPYGFATTVPEREHKIEVPIIEKGDRAGLFLKGEHGELIHIDSERLYKAFCDW